MNTADFEIIVENWFANLEQHCYIGLNRFNECITKNYAIAGQGFQMVFGTQRLCDYFSWQMSLFPNVEQYDMRINIWTDESIGCFDIPLNGEERVAFTTKLGDSVIDGYYTGGRESKRGYLYSWCKDRKEGWVVIHPEKLEYFIELNFMMTPLFSRMAAATGCALVHSACVGIENKGVLISGLSGSGKSSLAVACLMEGMQYVSDDALFLRPKDNLAFPTCSSIHVAPTIMKIFPELTGSEFLSRHGRGEKRHLNLEPLHNNFYAQLPVNAVINLRIDGNDEYGIKPMPWRKVAAPLLFSSAHLLGEAQNSCCLTYIMQALRSLPTYEFHLTGNLRYNAQLLKEFIHNNL